MACYLILDHDNARFSCKLKQKNCQEFKTNIFKTCFLLIRLYPAEACHNLHFFNNLDWKRGFENEWDLSIKEIIFILLSYFAKIKFKIKLKIKIEQKVLLSALVIPF